MKKIITIVIKCLLLSVFTAFIYWLLNYLTGKNVQLKSLSLDFAIIFAVYLILELISLFINKNRENR